jgi:5-methylcytosine-specific restriction endonuclease McrA
MNTLNDQVLKLNSKWQVLKDTATVQTALENMCRGAEMGIDTEQMRAIGWDEWITLPVRENDPYVATVRGKVRVPRVVMCVHYAGRELVRPPERPKPGDIRKRDGAICQITGELAPDGNVDHDIPVSRGGQDSWENMRWTKRDLNSKKADRTLAEMGMKPIRPARKPEPTVPELVLQAVHPEWNIFLKKRRK